MDIVVTGCYGFIGSHLVREFNKISEYNVIGIDNNIRGGKASLALLSDIEQANFIEGDLSDANFVSSLANYINLNNCIIFHCAAFNGTGNFYESPFEVLKHSTLPTVQLLDFLGKNKYGGKFVYFSSSEVYSWGVSCGFTSVPTPETADIVIGPPEVYRWSYGSSKAHGEYACFAAHKTFDIDAYVVRIHNIYGPRMGFNHFIPDFIDRALGGDYTLPGADEARSFLFVKDLTFIIKELFLIKCPKSRIINIGSDVETKIYDVATAIMQKLNLDPSLIQCKKSIPGSVKRRCPDISRLKSELDRDIQFTNLDCGLNAMVNHYQNQVNLQVEREFR
ncbi:NAD-dependent epimerase/dehydratase family protein [Roseobacter sp. HKCCA0882]|uniref:NAD-dependent epimerase/dehydratase family protein n=1 Tax=Roseobacter sp. HKCCA0882 TaxID=3120337 RepID=UPI0030EDF564